MTVCRCLSLDAVVASKVGRKQTAGAQAAECDRLADRLRAPLLWHVVARQLSPQTAATQCRYRVTPFGLETGAAWTK